MKTLLFLLLAAAAAAETGVQEKTVALGSCSDRSGPSKDRASAQLQGAQAYLKDVNERGGVNGRTIQLNVYDDGYDPVKAIDCFKKLMSDGNFAGALFLGTPLAAKYVPMAQENKVPVLGFISGAGFLYEPVKKYVFTVRASSLDALREQIKHLFEDLGIRHVAVIYQHDAYGAHVLESATLALQERKSQPVAAASYERGSLDVGGAIEEVRKTNPEAVVLGAVGAPMAEIIRKSKAAGFNPVFLTISDDPAFYKAGGQDVEGTVITQFVTSPQENLPTTTLFNKLMKKHFPDAKPGFPAFEGFLDAMVFVEGLKRAGPNPTRESFVQGLESIGQFDLGLGEGRVLGYGPDDHKGFNFVYNTVVKNGRPVPLKDWKTLKR